MSKLIVLSADLITELEACEREIAEGTSSFFAMCSAFQTIQERELSGRRHTTRCPRTAVSGGKWSRAKSRGTS